MSDLLPHEVVSKGEVQAGSGLPVFKGEGWEEVRYGYCQCGCGQKTPIAKRTRRELGHVRGKPTKYVAGHGSKTNRGFPIDDFDAVDTGHSTPCWLWNRPVHSRGYATMRYRGRNYAIHRLRYEIKFGRVPDGLDLDHLCRVRHCVNPDHLEPVSRAENTRRGAKAILTMRKAAEIRAAIKEGSRPVDLAKRYGVSASTISHLAAGRGWNE